MKKPNLTKKMEYHEHDDLPRDKFPETSSVASAQECTGLLYRSPVNQGELESGRGLFSMAIPKEGAAPRQPRAKGGCRPEN